MKRLSGMAKSNENVRSADEYDALPQLGEGIGGVLNALKCILAPGSHMILFCTYFGFYRHPMSIHTNL